MTRPEKIRKLANAVREYRGLYKADTKVWIHPPRPSKLGAVIICLHRLKVDVATNVERIDGFKTLGEFNQWIREL